jgi:hypothetical protein
MATDTLEFKLVMRPPKMHFAVAHAHRDNGKRFVAHPDEKLTAFLELEAATRGISQFHPPMHCKRHSAGTETYD